MAAAAAAQKYGSMQMERIKIKDGTTWPNPYGAEFLSLMWRLRYDQENVSKADLYNAASVMGVYLDLITHPAFTLKRVQEKISGIRKAWMEDEN